MITKTKLDFLQLAKKLTRSENIDVILEAAKKLENYIDLDNGEEDGYCLPENAIDFIEQSKVWSPAGHIPLKLYDYQKAWVEWLSEPIHPRAPHILIAARQMGLTTVLPLYSMWVAVNKPWSRVVIVVPRFAMAGDIRDGLAHAIHSMDLPIKSQNKGKIVFENGSEIDLVSSSDIASRGFKNVNVAVLMDAAHYSYAHANEIMNWTQRQIHLGAQVIIGSSSSYTEGFLHKMVNDHDYPVVSTPWHAHPERDEEWAGKYRDILSEGRFAIEMECKFINPVDPKK